MISGTNQLKSTGSNILSSLALNSLFSSGSSDSLLGALGGSSSFDSIYTQAMNQAKTPADKAKAAFLKVQFDNLNTLYSAVNGSNSSDSLFGGSDDSLFGSVSSLAMDLGSVPAQVNQLEQQLGLTPSSTSSASSASNTNAALGLEAGMLLNNDLANFGSDSGSGVNALA